jgi:hypothetical protein
MDIEKRRPHLLETNIFYLIAALIFLIIAPIVQRKDIFIGLVITEILIVFLPTVFYLKLRGYRLKEVLMLNRLSLKQVLLIPLITIFIYPAAMFINSLMLILLSFFGEIKPLPIPVPKTGLDFLVSFIVISILPGICEEVMFRGMIMKSYEKLGIKKAILFSALLFGIFHFNIQNLLGPIFLGIVFGYVVYKTNSIYSSMIAHVTNNTIATLLNYSISNYAANLNTQQSVELVQNIPYPLMMTFSSLLWGAAAIIPSIIAYFLMKALPRSNDSILGENNESYSIKEKERLSLLKAIPLFIVAFIFIVLTILFIMDM